MRFKADRRLDSQVAKSITGKLPDMDSASYSIAEISEVISRQIIGMSKTQVLEEGWLHVGGEGVYVDGWSGAEGHLVD